MASSWPMSAVSRPRPPRSHPSSDKLRLLEDRTRAAMASARQTGCRRRFVECLTAFSPLNALQRRIRLHLGGTAAADWPHDDRPEPYRTDAPMDHAALQQSARDHLWMHFTRMSAYDEAEVPIIVRGEGAYIYDAKGKRYLDALAGLFVTQVGHGRTSSPRRRASRPRARLHPLWSYAHPNAIELAAADRQLRARRPQPGLLHQRWRRGRRDRLEARQAVLQADRQARQAQGDLAARSPTTARPRAPSRSPACPSLKSMFEPLVPEHVPRTQHQHLPRSRCTATTPRRSAAGLPTRSPSRSRTKGPRPSRPSSSSRCRTPAAASRRRPDTSSGSVRSATSTTSCWSATRSSARSVGSATCSARSATATSPT